MPEIIYRPINSIKPLANNPRQITAVDFERLCKSVENNPDYFEARPLILSDRTGELVIIAGNMRHKAAKKLKLKEVPTILLPGLSEEREREIIIRDNVNNGSFDWDSLANEWSDLPLSEWGVDIPEDWAGVDVESPEDFAEVDENIETAHCCPKCGYKWSGKSNGEA